MTAHRPLVGWRTQRSARATIPIRRRVDKPVSQGKTGSQMSVGETAQKVPAIFAAGSPNSSHATCIMTTMVRMGNKVCTAISTAAEAKL
jgi:hypothetical protein